MACKLKTYDFCSRLGNTVFAKDFTIDVAEAEWELEMQIFARHNVLLETFKVGEGMTRVSEKTWRLNQRLEDMPNAYRYVLSYKIPSEGIVRDILIGKIIVNK